MNNDPINPTHYSNSKGSQLIDFTEELPYNRGNAIKYIYRAGRKDPNKEIEDLKKAQWCINREIERLTPKQ